MTRTIRAEVAKLVTLRMTYGILTATLLVTAFFTSLQANRSGARVAPLSTAAGLSTVTTSHSLALVLAAVLGVICATGEFRHGSATLTYLAVPDRRRVMFAKAAAIAPIGAAYGLAVATVSTSVGLIFVAARGDHVTLSTGTLIGHVLGAGVGAALFAVVGVAVGSVVRSQIVAVMGVFVWCLVIESILGVNVTSIRPYLPYTAASTLGGTKLGAAAFGPGFSVSDQSALPFVGAAFLLLGIAALVAAVADRTVLRHDVT